MRSFRFLSTAGFCATALLSLSAASAQTVTGTVVGLVTDPSGSVIAGAKITVHNLDTGVDNAVQSDRSGGYRVEFLPIGRYQVTVQSDGFGKQTLPVFQLEALQTAKFNVKLSLGTSETRVEVAADTVPILDTTDSTLSSTFTTNTIQNFPLNGLDFSALTLYVPGAVSTVGTTGTTVIERSTQYTDSVNLNGNRAQANNYTLEGIDLNETFNNLIAYSPAPESLQEVKVLTADSPADYGNVNGAGVVSLLKSGSNKFHGSAYGYLQDYRLNANSWKNDHANPKIPINSFSQDQFGATFGGPIKKDKLFFFVDYLGSRHHSGGTVSASVLTQAMRNGDFSSLLTVTAEHVSATQLFDPLNNYAPYVGDKGIPILNPVAKYLFAHPNLYPLPNAMPEDDITQNNLQGAQRSYSANNQGDIKLDYHPRQLDSLSGFFSLSTAYDATTAILPISFPTGSIFPSKLGGLSYVHIFSPSVVNSARIGYTRINWSEGLPIDETGQFGTNGDNIVGITFPNQAFQGFTAQNFSSNGNLSTLGNSASNNGSLTDNTYSYIDNLTITRGKNTISTGVQALRYENNYPTSNNNGYLGTLGYSGDFTSNPFFSATKTEDAAGFSGADFVLDRVSSASATLSSVNVGQRQWRAAGFIGDDYRATPLLTLNIAVRYEYDQPWVEENNKTGNVNIATGQVIYADHVPANAPAGSGVCSNRACYQANYRQLTPRLGFAYQAKPRFVIRGGYGATSFFEGNSSNQRLTSITPFIQSVNVTVATPTTSSPGVPRTAEQGFQGGTLVNGGTFNVYPQNIQPAYVQEYNLTTEFALTSTLSFQVGYLGESGQHIEDYGNLNQWLVNGVATSAPYYNNKYLGINAIDPSISIGSNPLLITESRAVSNYNSLQTVLRQRTSHGLEFTLNYTYSKAFTNSTGNYAVNVSGANSTNSGAFQNYYNSAADYGPAPYDVKNNFSGTAVYALPVGRGKDYLSNINGFLNEVIGGWKLSTAAVAYSGFPETILGPGNNSQSDGNSRPNQYRALKIVNRTPGHWYGTDPSATPCKTPGVDNGVCAFGVPANNTFGNASNGNTRGPRYVNVDLSVFKDFKTFREQTLGFRFDAFNAFNIVSYGNPDTGITDGDFGDITDQSSPTRSQERRLQFSANYRF